MVLQAPNDDSNHGDIELPAPTGGDPPNTELRTLDPKAVHLWRVSLATRGVAAAAGILALELILDLPAPVGLISGTATVLAVAVTLLIPPMRYRRWRFGLEDEHLRLVHGILFRTTSIVPYARIQHVDTRHGPVDRWLGLASLVVFTAGTRGAILTIPALAAADAEEMRDRLAALSGTGDAV